MRPTCKNNQDQSRKAQYKAPESLSASYAFIKQSLCYLMNGAYHYSCSTP
ncbi:hypothetical protein AcetOrient_orf01111 [Acetobacter orientalis]|uniref:Uncharacterized protein n=1 Tax=Acetobacter orientalis TaxID=146474 RepID=A0A2Z5ZFZ5_9PROT|nr:hypothetical protein AcetOrient_orf01111 [Acetobacter orientalis]